MILLAVVIGINKEVNCLLEWSQDWEKFDALDDFIQDQEQGNELIQMPNTHLQKSIIIKNKSPIK